METLDKINRRYGKSCFHLASQGFKKSGLLELIKNRLIYTTQLSELAIAVC